MAEEAIKWVGEAAQGLGRDSTTAKAAAEVVRGAITR
jgi:hypothetical protein